MLAELRTLRATQRNFGEYIFEYSAEILRLKVERCHVDKTDFLLEGQRIDVKSSLVYKSSLAAPKPYKGPREPNVQYCKVEFFKKGARLSIEGRIFHFVDEQTLRKLLPKWKLKHKNTKLEAVDKTARNKLLDSIRSDIENFFENHGVKVRVIYRTCQKDFGSESPGNLIVRNVTKYDATIFLSFKDYRIATDNLQYIVAFPHSKIGDLPVLKKIRLHAPKVDVANLPKEYIFKDVDNLRNRYFKTA